MADLRPGSVNLRIWRAFLGPMMAILRTEKAYSGPGMAYLRSGRLNLRPGGGDGRRKTDGKFPCMES